MKMSENEANASLDARKYHLLSAMAHYRQREENNVLPIYGRP